MILIGSTIEELTVAQIWDKYRKDAKRRGYPFELTRQEVEDLIFANCQYCNRTPSNQQGKFSAKVVRSNGSRMGTARYSGIDRMDNSVGYLAWNCVPCCSICNRAKHSLSYEEWTDWLRMISANVASF